MYFKWRPTELARTQGASSATSAWMTIGGQQCVRNPRGIASASERGADSQGGRPGGTATVFTVQGGNSQSTPYLRFRLLFDPPGPQGERQLAVRFDLRGSEQYVQDGDDVCLVGTYRVGSESAGVLINLTGRTVAWPVARPLRHALVFTAATFLFAAITSALWGNLLPALFFSPFYLIGLLYLLWRSAVSLRRPYTQLAKEVERLTSEWNRKAHHNPVCVIEGVVAFSRSGNQAAVEWVVFRGAVHDAQGELVDRLTWAIERRQLPGDLRRGDTVRVPGMWHTGEVQRADFVELV